MSCPGGRLRDLARGAEPRSAPLQQVRHVAAPEMAPAASDEGESPTPPGPGASPARALINPGRVRHPADADRQTLPASSLGTSVRSVPVSLFFP
jgi:hypothetical protein